MPPATKKSPEQLREEARQRQSLKAQIDRANTEAKFKANMNREPLDFKTAAHQEEVPFAPEYVNSEGGMQMVGDGRFVIVYSTETGVASRARVEQIVSMLQPDGKGIVHFTTDPSKKYKYVEDEITGVPHLVPKVQFKCLLHPEHEMREWLDSIGLAGVECGQNGANNPKSNLPSEFAVRQHMMSRHPQSWALIQQMDESRKRDEDRELQKAMLAAMTQRRA